MPVTPCPRRPSAVPPPRPRLLGNFLFFFFGALSQNHSGRAFWFKPNTTKLFSPKYRYRFMDQPTERQSVVIVGAGPAGLTAAYLLTKEGWTVTVLEVDPTYVGGISRTVKHE